MADFPHLFDRSGVPTRYFDRRGDEHGRLRDRGSRDFGQWGDAIRECAGWDPEHYERVAAWDFRDGLLAWEARCKQHAAETYRNELLVWAVRSVHMKEERDRNTPPKPPAILSD